MSILGGSLIWAGWYSFNAGSALQANEQAALAVINTHLAGCMSALIWTVFAYFKDGHWHLTEIIGGAYAGLAAVTPGSGYISPGSAIIVGAIGGVASFFSCQFVKETLKIDDVLDVFSLQGVPGIIGGLMVGVFAEASLQGGNPGKDGLLYSGSFDVLFAQAVSLLVVVCWTAFSTNAIFTAMHFWLNVDVSAETDELGLDVTQLGERAYDDALAQPLDLDEDVITNRMCEAASNGDMKTLKLLLFAGCDVDSQDYDGRCPLALAASEGHLQLVMYLVEQHGANINLEDRYGNVPLEDAICHGQLHVAKYLEGKGAIVTKPQAEESKESLKFRICEAANGGHEKRLEQLLLRSPKLAYFADYDKRSPLHLACASGHANVVRLLLFHGANPMLKDRWNLTPLDEAIRHEHQNCVDLINESLDLSYGSTSSHSLAKPLKMKSKGDALPSLKAIMKAAGSVIPFNEARQSLLAAPNKPKRRESAIELKNAFPSEKMKEKKEPVVNSAATRMLCNAAGKSDLDELRRVIKKDPDCVCGVDYDGRSALHVAASEGHVSVVEILLSNDSSNINSVDRWKRTPLFDAVDHGHEEAAKLLRSKGATIVNEERAFKFCTLSYEGDLEGLKKCFAKGEDLDVSDYDGRTALHLAATEGHAAIVTFLLDVASVNPSPVDRFGNTPFDDADDPEIKEMLSSPNTKFS
jgi:ankyrin repeat protein